MEIYIGNEFISYLNRSGDINELFSSDEIFVKSKTQPKITINLIDGGILFIWGYVYSLLKDEKYIKYENCKPINNILRNIVEQNDVNNILKKIRRSFLAVLIESNKSLKIFGDSFNKKDLYYKIENNNLIASSELNPVINKNEVKDYNQHSLASIFNIYGMLVPKKKLFIKI